MTGTMTDTDTLLDDALLAELIAFRHAMHQNPETGFEVAATAARVAARLRAAGLEVTTGVGGTGLVATLQCGAGTRAIGIRADLDALPITEQNHFAHRSTVQGKFHGCGHDGHTTMVLGAALLLAAGGGFDGRVHFIFQPDEENGQGAQAMVDDGLFRRFPMEAIYGIHNLPGMAVGHFATQPGALTAFEDNFEIEIIGRGGHASAPELAIDPLVAGAEMLLALQTIVSRALPPREHGVVSVTEFITDGARNVLPSTVTLRGDTRGYTDGVSATMERRMGEIVAGVAGAHGATATLRYTREFQPVVNHPDEVAAVVRGVEQVPGASIDAEYGRVGFSEDFARYLRHCPGCFILMGNGTEAPHTAALHNPHYDFNDQALPFGIQFWRQLVLRRLAP